MKHFYLLTALTICLNYLSYAQSANDTCANAELINVDATSTTYSFDINSATINNEEGCSGTTNDYADVWFEFTMPFNGNVYVGGSISWNMFALYDSCSGAQIQCGVTNQLFTSLTSGTTYKLRVFRASNTASNTGYQSFFIQAFQEASNDDCASAETITVTTASTTTINFEIGGASINNEEGCTGTTNDYADIWYEFTMPVTGNIYIEGGINWNIFALYDSCSGTQIQCGITNQLITGLTSGTTYKLRVLRLVSNADNAGYKSFTIQAFQEATNDDCASAETISVTTTSATTVNFEIAGADINNEVGCPGITNDYADIWYEFTMPVNGNVFVNGNISWNIFALYDSCSGTQLHCSITSEIMTDLTAGTTYKLRVFRLLSNVDNAGYKSFTIQAFEKPANDTCATSENITLDTASATSIDFEITGAEINYELGCNGTTADYADMWYDFTMPVNGNVFVDGVISWNNFTLFDSCNGTEIQCGLTDELFTGLTAGTNYKLRVFRLLANADNAGYKTFTIQPFEVITNDDCATAETISVTSTPSDIYFGVSGAVINNEVGCDGDSAQDLADVWYQFTMPFNGSISINGTIGWNYFALYDDCGTTQLDCFNLSGDFYNLVSGNIYKLRAFRTQIEAGEPSFKEFSIVANETLSVASFQEKSVTIYPNPAQNILNINTNQPIENISITDINGRLVLKQDYSSTIDISNISKGIYFLSLRLKNSTITKKIIIK